MTLESYLNEVKTQSPIFEFGEKQKKDEEGEAKVREAFAPYLTEEQLRDRVYASPEFRAQIPDLVKMIQETRKETWGREGENYTKELDDTKLKDTFYLVNPVKSDDGKGGAHKKAYELAQNIERAKAKDPSAIEKIQEAQEQIIEEKAKKAATEVTSKLTSVFGAERAANWAKTISMLEETRYRGALQKDPFAVARMELNSIAERFYKEFGSEDNENRTKAIGEYMRSAIVDRTQESFEGLGEVERYISAVMS